MFLLFIATVPAPGVPVAGTLFVLTGFAVRLLIGKRRFERRGLGGLQQFPNYWAALLVTLLEWLLSITSFAMILFGILLLCVHWYNLP